ncbi:MAG: acetylornithine aminotransferase [Thermoplasmatales archaeon A-plasma]|jgi:acetylornithine/LysW-gamma-L-lysine aminotransferase|nr:MAG: acetylornithine aminotransferase [Thermoplasmatales archaeon A-plasma]
MMDNEYFQKIEDEFLAGTYQKIPVLAARAQGANIWDLDGKEYLDLMSGYGVAILGHSDEKIKEAIMQQMEKVYITHASVYSPARAEFLKDFMSIAPRGLNRAFLSNSGTEAVEAAIKIAVKSTRRHRMISMERGYHGKTLGSLSVTHSSKYRKSFQDLLVGDVEFVKFGDAEMLRKALSSFDVAAVFLEPVQGEGGINLPGDQYLKEVREMTEASGTLLIMDEIQSGLGRTGKMWAHEHWGITPDIMTVGKGIGGGIPMGVTVGRSEFVDALEIGEQSSTTGGNPLACAAGSAVIDRLRNGYVEKARDTGKYFLERMQEDLGNHRLVSHARGIGMMLALELRIRFLPVLMNLLDRGVITLYSGINIIRMLPPYILTREQVDEAIVKIKGALDDQLKQGGAA